MDVGADNFRFTLDDPEKRARTIRYPKTAELHLDSLDRYTVSDVPIAAVNTSTPDQNTAKLFGPVFAQVAESPTNNCLIQTKRNLIYGYMSRVALTQFNLNYNVPTVVTGYNDKLSLFISGGIGVVFYTIPQGFYTTTTLASTLQTLLRATPGNPIPGAIVTTPSTNTTIITTGVFPGFLFASGNALTLTFNPGVTGQSVADANNYGRVWRMLGVMDQVPFTSTRLGVANLRPTDYVDIVSQALTNYKDTKDGNSSVASPGSVIARVWLNEGFVNNQTASGGYPDPNLLGGVPLTITKSWINPNWSQWSPNETINRVDITLLDMWGNPLFWSPTYQTEWSATLTVTE
jgi:hypothetical protein